jgi:hypothetical protein
VACAEAEPVWFTTVSQRSGIQVYQPGQGNVSLTEWTRDTGADGRLSRLSQGLWLDSLLAWQNSAVNDLLSVRRGELLMKPCVQGMCMVPVSGIAGNLWQQHITTVTALPPDAVAPPSHCRCLNCCCRRCRADGASAAEWCSGVMPGFWRFSWRWHAGVLDEQPASHP